MGRQGAWVGRGIQGAWQGVLLLVANALTGASLTTVAASAASVAGDGAAAGAAPQLHVSGHRLVNAQGTPVVLHGVDRSGAEYMCVQGNGIFDGPFHKASISAMKQWDVT